MAFATSIKARSSTTIRPPCVAVSERNFNASAESCSGRIHFATTLLSTTTLAIAHPVRCDLRRTVRERPALGHDRCLKTLRLSEPGLDIRLTGYPDIQTDV